MKLAVRGDFSNWPRSLGSLRLLKGKLKNSETVQFADGKSGQCSTVVRINEACHSREWSISNFSCSSSRSIASHSGKDLAFHSLLRWKFIDILPILPTSVIHFFLKRLGECTFRSVSVSNARARSWVRGRWTRCARNWENLHPPVGHGLRSIQRLRGRFRVTCKCFGRMGWVTEDMGSVN